MLGHRLAISVHCQMGSLDFFTFVLNRLKYSIKQKRRLTFMLIRHNILRKYYN